MILALIIWAYSYLSYTDVMGFKFEVLPPFPPRLELRGVTTRLLIIKPVLSVPFGAGEATRRARQSIDHDWLRVVLGLRPNLKVGSGCMS